MAQPLNFNEAMGSPEAHLELARKRVRDAEEAIALAKTDAQKVNLKENLREAQSQLEALEEEMSSVA